MAGIPANADQEIGAAKGRGQSELGLGGIGERIARADGYRNEILRGEQSGESNEDKRSELQ